MVNAGASIEAVLKLNATGFTEGIDKSTQAIDKFATSFNALKNSNPSLAMDELVKSMNKLDSVLNQVNTMSKRNVETFNQLANAVHKMGLGLQILQSDSVDVVEGVNTMNSIFKAFQGTLEGTTLKLENIATVHKQVETATRSNIQAQQQAIATLNSNRNAVMGLITGKNQDTSATEKNTQATVQNSNAKQKDVASTNQLTNSTNRLKSAMSSLRMIGTMVGSMLAYNFAHKLLVATGETIHAKSEMEGYFKMLNFGQSDVNHFNKALDDTVKQFQRVNKYSLGETISSIGVEFNLSTKEMEKAMKVTSMITSEYLRAGRNANEASLAVKDVLQGQFQRLSRETGVKGEQLKEAGWSGDTTDVLGLMEALEKVAESRNWDVFAEKANSLNDILTITQNRFGEWSADMVNVVQPTIVNVFNAIMSAFDHITPILSDFWVWLNNDGWGQAVVKIGALGTAILTVSQMLLMYRTSMGLVEASQLGLIRSIASLVLGLKGQEVAEVGVRNAIMSKILGVQAETLAESGVTGAIQSKLVALKEDSLQQTINATKEKLSTLALEENTLQTQINTLQQDLNTASSQKLITAKEEETIQEEINTAQKKLNSIASMEQEVANTGLVASLYLLGTGEAIVTGETSALTIAWGVLNGVFALSPIGWVTTAILGLAGAIYVLTGGLDSGWEKMQIFNQTVEKGTESLKPYQDRVNKLQTQLDEAKAKYGENSEQVQKLQTKYDNAKDSLDKFNESLQYGVKITNNLNEEQDQLTANMDAITRKNYGSLGHSQEEVDETVKQMNAMGYGYDKSYLALQKLVKMQSNFDEEQQKSIPILTEHGRSVEENAQNLGRWNDKYQEYIKESTNANLADNWWDWAWASMYAGMSKNDANAMLLTEAIETKFRDIWTTLSTGSLPPFFKGDIDKQIGDYINGLGDSFNQWVANCDWGESINGLWENFSQSVQSFDWIGSLQGLFESLPDPLTEFTNYLFNGGASTDLAMIGDWAMTFIVNPMADSLWNGIMAIPLVSDILALFGLVNGENSGSSQKGKDIGNAFKTSVEDVIRGIPILGDILQLLGVIPQANGDAHSKGEGVGSNIKTGTQSGMGSLGSMIIQEFTDALNGIGKLGQQAYDTAKGWADKLWQGVNSVLQRHSPGFFHDQFQLEFGTDIPNAINESGATAYSVAQSYAQNIKQGIQDSGTTTIGMDGMVQDYQSDAQIISDSSQMMGMTTTTAFNDMALQVNATTGQMQTNVTGTYSAIASNQTLSLNQMKQQNTSAYNEMYLKSNQSLVQMRDSTSHITQQMTSAWNQMKDSIVASANKLKNDSTVHFNSLSDTIGSFYRKIQNPSNWGGSPHGGSTHRNVRAGRSFASTMRGFAGGRGSTYTGSNTMTIASLKKKICPNGDCNGIFDGWNSTDVVDVRSFLSLITDGGFGWGDWSGNHFNYIRDTSNQWGMKSPTIQLVGGIPTNANYKVGDFANGSPKISFGSFQSMAESIYSAIPYRFYYNSDWKGSWLGALQSGACNCYDGALSLIAFANACGFSGSMASGTWTDPDGTSYPHVWAVINGKKMDTTAWQQRGSWSAGSPNIRTSNSNPQTNNNTTPVNIEVNINGNVYGVDDLDRHIEEGIDKGLEKHFNTSYTVGV